MGETVNINGTLFPPEEATVSIFDHGFLFGDSVYEVLSTHRGRFYTVRKHMARLFNSAKGINLNIPWSFEELEQEILKTARAAGNKETYVRLMATRGVGDLNIDPASCLHPALIIVARPAIRYPEEFFTKGIDIIISSVQRNNPEAVNPGLKTGNYLNNVLAIAEAGDQGARDALMLNSDGFITECTTSNFYFVRDGAIRTASLDSGVLPGVTRHLIQTVARENDIPFEEGWYGPDELTSADEAFISSTTKNVIPVARIDGRRVAHGLPGEITRRLMDRMQEKLDELVGLC